MINRIKSKFSRNVITLMIGMNINSFKILEKIKWLSLHKGTKSDKRFKSSLIL